MPDMRSRNERKAASGRDGAGPVRRRLRAAGAAIVAHGPAILLATGTFFVIGMVVFLYFIPLPAPAVPVATRVFDRNGNLVGSLFSQNRVPVALAQVPEVLRKGIVAQEDERFYGHHGIDPAGVVRALVRNIRARRVVEGGSTITEQVARSLYLTQEITISRKVVEALLALKLERVYTKDEILELYLNEIYLGNGAYGVEVAAETYFGKPVSELTLAQSAMIAGLPANPEGYSPYNHPDRAVSRRDFILDFWVKKGIITAGQAAAAKQEPITLASVGPPAQVGPYYMEYITTLLREASAAGARGIPSMSELYTGGYRIFAAIDLKIQQAADKAVAAWAPAGTKDDNGVTQPQVALVAMDPTNGYILAMVGGRDYAETKLNRAVPRGTMTEGMRRQPGSAFKAFLYTAVLDSGFPLTATQTCEPVEFPAGNGKVYSPTDYGKNPYHWRPLSIREAVRVSDNVAAVKWCSQITPAREIQFAEAMGIDAPLSENLSLALGSSEVSVLEMARGYSTLANGGFRVEPQALLRLEDRYGRVIYDQTRGGAGVRPQPAVDERVAYLMNQLLKEPFSSGGTAAGLLRYFSRPACGKTGTTDEQYDTWFVGYTPQIACAVWVGNDTPSPLPGYGSTLPGPIWANFMAAAHEGLPIVDFPEPAGILHVTICTETGLLPNPSCPTREEIFLPGTQPRQVDPTIHWGEVFPGQGGGAGGARQPGQGGPGLPPPAPTTGQNPDDGRVTVAAATNAVRADEVLGRLAAGGTDIRRQAGKTGGRPRADAAAD